MNTEKIINDAWENRDQVSPNSDESLKNTVNQIIDEPSCYSPPFFTY